jgi:YidC/Oxa1 family membrane protein insertase
VSPARSRSIAQSRFAYINGAGLEISPHHFGRRPIPFHCEGRVASKGAAPVTLSTQGSRATAPKIEGVHLARRPDRLPGEGPQRRQLHLRRDGRQEAGASVTNAWLGITDKYWAAALIPDTATKVSAQFAARPIGSLKTYEAIYNSADPQTIAPGATGAANVRLFAGAKEVAVIDGYNDALKLNHFDKLIDWGMFYSSPRTCSSRWTGSIDTSALSASRSCSSPSSSRASSSARQQVLCLDGEDEGGAARDDGDPRRYGDDKMKQQQAMMSSTRRRRSTRSPAACRS